MLMTLISRNCSYETSLCRSAREGIWSTDLLGLVKCIRNINAVQFISIFQKRNVLIFSSHQITKDTTYFPLDSPPCYDAKKDENVVGVKWASSCTMGESVVRRDPFERVSAILYRNV